MLPIEFIDPFERASIKGAIVLESNSYQTWRAFEKAEAKQIASRFIGMPLIFKIKPKEERENRHDSLHIRHTLLP